MKTWSDFLNEVSPYVENCPTPIVEHEIRNAAIEFCQRTALWRREMVAINVTLNTHSYDLSANLTAAEEAISAIDYAYLTETEGETDLGVTTEDTLKNTISTWRTRTAVKPEAIMLTDTENARLYPIPEESITGGLITGLILKPSRTATGVPDWIHEQWAEKIAHGAKAKIFSMKSRPWYDAQEAIDEKDNFDMAIKDATIRVNKGHSRANLSVQMRPIA